MGFEAVGLEALARWTELTEPMNSWSRIPGVLRGLAYVVLQTIYAATNHAIGIIYGHSFSLCGITIFYL